MNPQEIQDEAAHRLRLAEAELALLKQELVLQQLIDTREPSERSRHQLQKLRDVVTRLNAQGTSPPRTDNVA